MPNPPTMTPDDWVQFGHPGHFCDADRCRFSRHTHVGAFCISTVGDYHPSHAATDAPHSLDTYPDHLYETAAFLLANHGQPLRGEVQVKRLTALDTRYSATEQAAEATHLAMCHRFSGRQARPTPKGSHHARRTQAHHVLPGSRPGDPPDRTPA